MSENTVEDAVNELVPEFQTEQGMRTFGIVTLVLGFLCFLAPLLIGKFIAVMVGVLVLIAGIVRLAWAFQSRTFGQGLFMLIIGGLTLLCGLMMVTSPIFAAGVLTLLLTFYFLLEGVTELTAAFQLKSASGRGWLILDGVLSLLLGLMIWSQYPLSGAWAIAILLGIKLIFIGVLMLTVRKEFQDLKTIEVPRS